MARNYMDDFDYSVVLHCYLFIAMHDVGQIFAMQAAYNHYNDNQ